MTDTKNDLTVETSIPTAILGSVLCTEELQRRPSRPPDYDKEDRALEKLVSAFADSTRTIFQTLAETILEITQRDLSDGPANDETCVNPSDATVGAA